MEAARKIEEAARPKPIFSTYHQRFFVTPMARIVMGAALSSFVVAFAFATYMLRPDANDIERNRAFEQKYGSYLKDKGYLR